MKINKQFYRCDICGNVDEWGKTWYRYSSIKHDETCRDRMPTVCSKKCRDILQSKLDSGEIKVPKVGRKNGAIHADVIRDKVGY